MNKSHLISRLTTVLNAKELNARDCALNDVTTAFMQLVNKADQTIKVTPFAARLANLAKEGQPIYFRDPDTNTVFYVTAIKKELVAVFYAISSGYDIYGVRSTNQLVLEELGIFQPTFRDTGLIDKIFGWDAIQIKPMEAATKKDTGLNQPNWRWHQPETMEERVVTAAERPVAVTVPLQAVAAPKAQHNKNTELGLNQMQQAFANSEGRGQQQGNRRNNDRQRGQQQTAN